MQQAKDVGANPRSCCGTEGHHRDTWAEISQLPKSPVIRTEIMPPCTDAVGFINSQGNKPTRGRLFVQYRTGRFPLQPLGRQIKKSESSGVDLFKDSTTLGGLDSTVQTSRFDAATAKLKHLILHQGDERRDNHYET